MNSTRRACDGRRLPAGVRLLSVAALCVAAAGCGKKDVHNEVTGKVSYKGTPLNRGLITLTPAASGLQPISGPIKNDGTFDFTGVPAGQWKVSFLVQSPNSAPPGYHRVNGFLVKNGDRLPPGSNATNAPQTEQNAAGPAAVEVPRKYADPNTSQLTWDITKGKNNREFNLD